MNQKWRILLGICLVVMVCVPSVSAVIQFPTPQNSLTQSSVTQLSSIKTAPDISENAKTSRDLFDSRAIPFSKRTQKVNLTRISVDSTKNRPFNPATIFPPMITTDSGVSITKEEAIAKAYSGGVCLTEPINAYLKRFRDGNPFVKKWVWVVEIRGYIDPTGDDPCGQRDSWTEGDPIKYYIPIWNSVFIDAITGEILDYSFFE
jgi:hypothetical protein